MMREDIVVICNYICNVFTKTLRNMIGMCIYKKTVSAGTLLNA